MRVVHNSNSTMHLPVLAQAAVARRAGCDGLFVRAEHVRRYLELGLPVKDLRAALSGFEPLNLGALSDVERARRDAAALAAEAEDLAGLAAAIGATNVQLLSGPTDPDGPYLGPGADRRDIRLRTAGGLRVAADAFAAVGVACYLEPLAWTPLAGLELAVESIDEAGRPNLALVLDLWHLWHAGVEPDDLARLDRQLISGVDFCDSLGPRGPGGGADQATRRVWPGEGEIPLQVWADAIHATGFDGWWGAELYSPPHWELDPDLVATRLAGLVRSFAARTESPADGGAGAPEPAPANPR
jgi:sugar phosphate isomerase/epimerase